MAPEAPRRSRPLNAFFIFKKSWYNDLKLQDRGMVKNQRQFNAEAGRRWRAMSHAEQQPFYDQAIQYRNDHHICANGHGQQANYKGNGSGQLTGYDKRPVLLKLPPQLGAHLGSLSEDYMSWSYVVVLMIPSLHSDNGVHEFWPEADQDIHYYPLGGNGSVEV
ncbi:hypothetical protein NLI96_g5093 [Meripilus lineatus]|uniref:HMG box domain-containing protein n=1 Tax=Meripilus lineatus TaxID=2056292 RepID=A0AAD5V8Y7_9APHY|nr:hypothetical protein NLI96_g5093 [Physisporinus lineatus]